MSSIADTRLNKYNVFLNALLTGDTFITRNRIRLTRHARSLNGSIWSNNRVKTRDWEVQLSFLVKIKQVILQSIEAHFRITVPTGEAADGMAIWYTRNSGTGTAWGAPSKFSGIGIILDTYVNQFDENTTQQSTRLFMILNSDMVNKQIDSSVDGRNLMIGEQCDLGNS
ncbi:hypothetical protein DICVIV_07165 [Dictyocaulus viviparus]|uniref:L-type lectin-like domain-containing protein n=1 Tax=Dictyocaulus viviparus TaxID=29172 RepID=A0A0D8XSN6_DICVI|nr:hypothetical protein DICVIV_07165 [Dictyocaulus viviparus]